MSLAEEFGVPKQTRFEIRITVDLHAHTIQPVGELDLATTGQLHAALLAALDSGSRRRIVLDLSRLTFIDSSGIHLIVLAGRLAAERHRELLLLRGPRQVQSMLDLTGITGLLVFAD
jgi:anti-sigma B factor antagonist